MPRRQIFRTDQSGNHSGCCFLGLGAATNNSTNRIVPAGIALLSTCISPVIYRQRRPERPPTPPRRACLRRRSLPPHLARHLGDEAQFGDLIVERHLVALDRAGEAALRAEGEL